MMPEAQWRSEMDRLWAKLDELQVMMDKILALVEECVSSREVRQ